MFYESTGAFTINSLDISVRVYVVSGESVLGSAVPQMLTRSLGLARPHVVTRPAVLTRPTVFAEQKWHRIRPLLGNQQTMYGVSRSQEMQIFSHLLGTVLSGVTEKR